MDDIVVKIKKELIEVPCDNCRVNTVMIWTHTPYFGRFCGECAKGTSISVVYE